MQHLAVQAYGTAQRRTADEKDIEQILFRQVTDALDAVATSVSPSPSETAAAVHWNQSLWTALTVDIVHPDNGLDEATKQNLLQLAEFVRRHSLKVLASEADIEDLIAVNVAIVKGAAGPGAEHPAEGAR